MNTNYNLCVEDLEPIVGKTIELATQHLKELYPLIKVQVFIRGTSSEAAYIEQSYKRNTVRLLAQNNLVIEASYG